MESVRDDFFVAQAKCVQRFSPAAGIFARQLLYWEGKGETPGGWIYKTQKEWTAETGLSRRQQEKAREILVGKGVLEEEKRSNPRNGYRPQLYFRLNLGVLFDTLNPNSRMLSNTEHPRALSNTEHPSLSGISAHSSPTTNIEHPREPGNTERSYTKSTSENTTETILEKTTKSSLFQSGGEPVFDGTPANINNNKKEEEKERVQDPVPISDVMSKREKPQKSQRANPFEINRIVQMLTNERYPTCGVYRRFEEGRLSDQELLEAVAYELTGSFEVEERHAQAVEECVHMLKEEEELA